MNLFSHLVVAHEVKSVIQPDCPSDYYWGTLTPDIRYYTGTPRSQTHLSTQKLQGLLTNYPDLKSFIQGYQVHCLADEIDLVKIIYRRFPLSLFKKRVPAQFISVLLEFYHIENTHLDLQISGTHNTMLQDLGISRDQVKVFAQVLNNYVYAPSFGTALSAFQNLGLLNDDNVEKYIATARALNRNWLLKNALFLGIKADRVIERITASVISLLSPN